MGNCCCCEEQEEHTIVIDPFTGKPSYSVTVQQEGDQLDVSTNCNDILSICQNK